MFSVKLRDIPTYLKSSAFFVSLGEDESEISVPIDCCKPDPSVNNSGDLQVLLKTLRFWGVERLPPTMVYYVATSLVDELVSILEVYERDLECVSQLLQVVRCVRERQVCEAAELENIEIVTCLLELHYPACYEMNRAVDIAARNGNVEMLRVLRFHNCPFHKNTAISAALAGKILSLKYVVDKGCPVAEDLVNYAFAGGSLDCLKYVREAVGCKWTDNLFAAINYITISIPCEEKLLVQCLDYAQTHGCPHDPKACEISALKGLALMLKRLHEHGWPWDKVTVSAAARRGHLDCLQYALEQGCPQPEELMWDGMCSGNVQVMLLLWHRGLSWPAVPLHNLMYKDDVDVNAASVCLIHAYKLGCPRHEETCFLSAQYGWLDLLVDAHEHGCSWDYFCTKKAAENGHLDCLVYLHEHGCPWDVLTTAAALRYRHFDCLQYAIEHGCPVSSSVAREYKALCSK